MSDEFKNLDNLERKLNKPKASDFGEIHHSLKEDFNKEIPNVWDNRGVIISPLVTEEKGVSFSMKLLIGSIILLVGVLVYTGIRVSSLSNTVSNSNIDVSVGISSYIEGGEVTPVSVSVENRNKISLEDSVLTISYKKGVSSQDETQEVSEKRNIGTLIKNSLAKQDFKIQIYGEESESKNINAKLEYKVAGSNAVFSKVVSVSTIIKTPAVSVHIEGPSNLVQGQSGTYILNIKNNTSTTTVPFVVSLSPPLYFHLDSVSPKQDGKDLIWRINQLAPKETTSITVIGSFDSSVGDKTNIRATVGASNGLSNNISTIYSTDLKDISLNKPPMVLSVGLSTGMGVANILRYGDKAFISISYENTSGEILHNIEITANLSGSAPIINAITDDGTGYIDSANKKIIWNKSTNPALAELQPGAKGAVNFTVPIITRGSNSPNLRLEVNGKSDSLSSGSVSTNISNNWLTEGVATLTAWTSYRNSPFQNSGPVPPKANIETSYTIHLVASTINALDGAKVSLVLPFYTTWKNVYTNNAPVSYDSMNKTVVWDIGSLEAGKSTVLDIQVSVRPSISQIGASPKITSNVTFESTERESHSFMKTLIFPLTTNLHGELTGDGSGTVVAQ